MTRGRVFLAVAAAGLLAIAFLSVYVWRQNAINVLLFIAFLWLLGNRFAAESRDEDTRADVDEALGRADKALSWADEALGRVDAIEDHLTGLEPEGTGRHASRPGPPRYGS